MWPLAVKCTDENATMELFNPFALRKAKIVCNFGLSECKMVKFCIQFWPTIFLYTILAFLCAVGLNNVHFFWSHLEYQSTVKRLQKMKMDKNKTSRTQAVVMIKYRHDILCMFLINIL